MISGYSLEVGRSIRRWCSVRPLLDLFLVTLLTCDCAQSTSQLAPVSHMPVPIDMCIQLILCVIQDPSVSELSVLMVVYPGSSSTARVFQELLPSLP